MTKCFSYPDEFESTRIIGERQFKKAADLFTKASEEIQGKVDYRHAYVDFSQLEVTINGQNGGSEVVKTCPAAMGFGRWHRTCSSVGFLRRFLTSLQKGFPLHKVTT